MISAKGVVNVRIKKAVMAAIRAHWAGIVNTAPSSTTAHPRDLQPLHLAYRPLPCLHVRRWIPFGPVRLNIGVGLPLVLLVGLVSVTLVPWLMPFPRGAGTARWMPASVADKAAIMP